MATLPQLIEEDIHVLNRILGEILSRSEATTALIVDKGGFLITCQGEAGDFDLTTISALAAGAYLANQTIANLIHEQNFTSDYQQGEKFSLLAINVDENCLLLVIFRAQIGVGVVKFYATRIRERIARQLQDAHDRAPQAGLDLSELNLANPASLFRMKN
jgi:predicted regulator of Ras-like GTPase activity (Roadblock/LC7/MglB family)